MKVKYLGSLISLEDVRYINIICVSGQKYSEIGFFDGKFIRIKIENDDRLLEHEAFMSKYCDKSIY